MLTLFHLPTSLGRQFGALVVMSITTMTFAARDFSARPGASDEHTLRGSVRSEQRSLAEKELPPEGGAPNLACGGVARRSQIHCGICSLLAPGHRPNSTHPTSP